MIVENWLQPNCSEGVIQVNRKDISTKLTKEQQEQLEKLWHYNQGSKESHGYVNEKEIDLLNKHEYETRYFLQDAVPKELLEFLRKHKIEFYGDDFVESDLKEHEQLHTPTTIERFARGEYKNVKNRAPKSKR
jgi:hypothetical protein